MAFVMFVVAIGLKLQTVGLERLQINNDLYQLLDDVYSQVILNTTWKKFDYPAVTARAV